MLTSALAISTNLAATEEHGRIGWIAVTVLTLAAALTTVLTRRFKAKRFTVVTCAMIGTTALIGLTVAALRLSGPSCPAACFDFENGTAGWGIRSEADRLLGKTLSTSDTVDAGSALDHGSLALAFQLGRGSADQAQIKIENVSMAKEITTSVYVPGDLPPTLTLSAFVLEHNDSSEGDRPEWIFYQTNPAALKAASWSRISFAKKEFSIHGFWPQGTWTSTPVGEFWHGIPLMVGLEIRDASRGPVGGSVYFDEISIR
jgi:hypothetical protein